MFTAGGGGAHPACPRHVKLTPARHVGSSPAKGQFSAAVDTAQGCCGGASSTAAAA